MQGGKAVQMGEDAGIGCEGGNQTIPMRFQHMRQRTCCRATGESLFAATKAGRL
jgi:hypothetical protein